MKPEDKYIQVFGPSDKDPLPDDWSVSCPNDDCNWEGVLSDCGTEWESEGWEYPEYQIATCPKCGEGVEL